MHTWEIKKQMTTETIIIKVLYFGIVQEIFGLSEKIYHLSSNATLQTLIDLHEDNAKFSKHASFFRYAINQKMIQDQPYSDILLKQQDCIAIIPPMSGG
jgi:molybdopterin converting factor small subunit